MNARGRNGLPDTRGNSYARRAAVAWLISPEAGWGGDGVDVPCWECGVLVGSDLELFRDRIIPGERGGRYVRENLAPHCALCSNRQGNRRTLEIAEAGRRMAEAATSAERAVREFAEALA